MSKFRVSQVQTIVVWIDVEAEDFDAARAKFQDTYFEDMQSETIDAEDIVVDDMPAFTVVGVFDATAGVKPKASQPKRRRRH